MATGSLTHPENLQAGDRFSKEVIFSKEAIREFATLVGDTNPLHHDEAAAAATQTALGDGLIASGAQTMSVMMAAAADYLAQRHPSVGLECSVKLSRPVRAGDVTRIDWAISDIVEVAKLKGWVVSLSGTLTRSDGIVAVLATSKALVWWP